MCWVVAHLLERVPNRHQFRVVAADELPSPLRAAQDLLREQAEHVDSRGLVSGRSDVNVVLRLSSQVLLVE